MFFNFCYFLFFFILFYSGKERKPGKDHRYGSLCERGLRWDTSPSVECVVVCYVVCLFSAWYGMM